MSKNAMGLQAQLENLRMRWQQFWQACSEQEKRLLTLCFAIIVLAVVYLVFIDPAITGRAKLEKNLPQLRLRAAQVQQLAQKAQSLQIQSSVDSSSHLDEDGVQRSLKNHGMKAKSITGGTNYVVVELADVSFANVMAWLDDVRNSYHVTVSDAKIEAQKELGNVEARLTLRQPADNPS